MQFTRVLALVLAISVVSRAAGQASRDRTEPAQAATPPEAPAPSPPPAASPDRPVSWKLLLPNMVHDQGRIWSFPAHLAHKRDWIPAATVLGITAGLFALDPPEASYFRHTATFQRLNQVFTGNATSVGMIAAPLSLYALGVLRKDRKMQHTVLLAGEAVAGAEILTTVLKDATWRVRPAGVPARGNFSDTWFEYGSSGSSLRGAGSFPSGHAIAAFSVATVIARRYGNHRWIPYVAYGTASLIAFCRLTLSAHFLSDVFMGSALGYSISRFVVLRR